jgi:hypothetical protein
LDQVFVFNNLKDWLPNHLPVLQSIVTVKMSMEHLRVAHGLASHAVASLDGEFYQAAVQTITPAMPPPKGEVSNFDNPPEAADGMRTKTETVGYVMTAIALVVVLIRIWTRAAIVKKGLGADDCKFS